MFEYHNVRGALRGICYVAAMMCGGADGMDANEIIVKVKTSGTQCEILSDLVGQVRAKHGVASNKSENNDKKVLANDKKLLDALLIEEKNSALRGDIGTFSDIFFLMTCMSWFDYCREWEVGNWSCEAYRENEKKLLKYSNKKVRELTTFLLEERVAPGLVLSKKIVPNSGNGSFSSHQYEIFVNSLRPGKK